MQSIASIKNILKGNISEVITHLKTEMLSASADMRFEAHLYKQKIEQLHDYQSKSTVVSQSVHNVDIFSIADEENFAFVNFLRVMNGMIIQTQTLELRKKLNETKEELLLEAIGEIWNRYGNTTKEIVLPFAVELESTDKLIITIPQAGDKKKLLDLSLKNVFYFKKEKLLQYEKLNPEIRVDRLMDQMQKDLRLPKQPRRIDCFDNSNFQGSFPGFSHGLFY